MTYATVTDAIFEHARNVGRDHPDVAWILTPYDIWHPNPYYRGPAVQHPEDEGYYDNDCDLDDLVNAQPVEHVAAPEPVFIACGDWSIELEY